MKNYPKLKRAISKYKKWLKAISRLRVVGFVIQKK